MNPTWRQTECDGEEVEDDSGLPVWLLRNDLWGSAHSRLTLCPILPCTPGLQQTEPWRPLPASCAHPHFCPSLHREACHFFNVHHKALTALWLSKKLYLLMSLLILLKFSSSGKLTVSWKAQILTLTIKTANFP